MISYCVAPVIHHTQVIINNSLLTGITNNESLDMSLADNSFQIRTMSGHLTQQSMKEFEPLTVSSFI